MRSLITKLTLLLLAGLFFGCTTSSERTGKENDNARVEPPVVSDERGDLILSWFADGGPQMASTVSEVPDGARGEVRVQDPSVPPEKRDPSVIFLADLTKKDTSGRYPVRVEKRADYEQKRAKVAAARRPVAPPPSIGSGPGTAALPPSGNAPVIMYATRHCPVCVKARRWLLERKIPYIEKDVERDSKAAQELAAKGRAQGVSTSGVPVFDIRGRLLPGFDPGAILKILSGMPPTQTAV
ncbi:MAG: glutaredoxin family protein [Deltaproteobacteria bacterium]|nr:glutaredoxin family protein [Deltaproteobacteria bacterium]